MPHLVPTPRESPAVESRKHQVPRQEDAPRKRGGRPREGARSAGGARQARARAACEGRAGDGASQEFSWLNPCWGREAANWISVNLGRSVSRVRTKLGRRRGLGEKRAGSRSVFFRGRALLVGCRRVVDGLGRGWMCPRSDRSPNHMVA